MAQHRKGTLTNARSQAKAALQRMPLGSVVMVGQWTDTGEYVAKAGGGMSWAHERFRPVEQWASAPKLHGTGRKMIKLEIKQGTLRRNPQVTYRLHTLLAPRFMDIAQIQFAIAELWLGHLKVASYSSNMTRLINELERRTGIRYDTVGQMDEFIEWHRSLPSGTRRKLRQRLKDGAGKVTGTLRRNPGADDPAVRLAIADAKRILGRTPRNLRGRR